MNGDRLASAEIYRPATGTFSAAPAMHVARQLPTATRLDDGTVLIVGGFGPAGSERSAEVYDPRTNAFSLVGSMSVGRYEHVAQRLENGDVLVAGGICGGEPAACGTTPGEQGSAELYDPATRSFHPAGSLIDPRYLAVAAGLPDGTVLVVGGQDDEGMLSTAEIYRP